MRMVYQKCMQNQLSRYCTAIVSPHVIADEQRDSHPPIDMKKIGSCQAFTDVSCACNPQDGH